MKQFFRSPKKIALAFLVLFIVIQFIRPAKNNGEAFGPEDITHSVETSDNVKAILAAACYDCHSDFTNHMWYENIQPLGWWISDHIKEGKRELNFSIFNTYKDKRKAHKFEEIAEQIEADEMPLGSYSIMHANAKLSEAEKDLLIKWAKAGEQKYKTGQE